MYSTPKRIYCTLTVDRPPMAPDCFTYRPDAVLCLHSIADVIALLLQLPDSIFCSLHNSGSNALTRCTRLPIELLYLIIKLLYARLGILDILVALVGGTVKPGANS